jgi:hypothetical protein
MRPPDRLRPLLLALLLLTAPSAALAADQDGDGVDDRQDNCAGVAKLWENGCEHSITGRVNEISRGGCYVEMMSPMRTGTAIRLELSVSGRMLRLEGIVRTSQPTIGMGVEFTRMAPADAERLCHIVSELAGEVPGPSPEPAAETPELSTASRERVGEAVLLWFGLHETLTREEFIKLMEHSARAELARS